MSQKASSAKKDVNERSQTRLHTNSTIVAVTLQKVFASNGRSQLIISTNLSKARIAYGFFSCTQARAAIR